MEWTHTKSALQRLECLLTCKICHLLINEPCSLEACDHYFCRHCVQRIVGVNSQCPECGSFAWIKDLKPNRQLSNLVSLCRSIRSGIENGHNIVENTLAVQKDPNSCESYGQHYQQDNEKVDGLHGLEMTEGLADYNSSSNSHNLGKYPGTTENSILDDSYNSVFSDETAHNLSNSSLELFSAHSPCFPDERNDFNREAADFNNREIITEPTVTNQHDSNKTHKGQKRKLSDCEQDLPKTSINTSNCDSESIRQTISRKNIKKVKEQNSIDHRSVSTPTRKKCSSAPSDNTANSSTSPSTRLLSSVMLSPGQLEKKNKRGEGLLHVAAIKGNLEDAKWLLEKGANPNARDNAGWSPLHEACNHGHAAIAKMLLDYGAIIDLPGGFDHDTPLHDAVANGRLEVVKLLVQEGAPLTPRNKRGMTPLDIAVSETMKDALKAFQSPSVSPNEKTSSVMEKRVKCVEVHNQETCKVILCSGLKTEQKELLEDCTRILGGKVANEFCPEVTHLVTVTNDSNHCARTIKYLSSILCGKWIVSFSWIKKCLSVKSWVDESPYEVKGTTKGKQDVPRFSRINAEKQLPSLFDGCQFYFCGVFHPQTPHKDNLIQLAKFGGGKVLTREPKSDIDYRLFMPTKDKKRLPLVDLPVVAYHAKPESEQYHCTRYIIYDPLSTTQPTHKYRSLSIAPVSWFLDCISNFEILDIPL